MNRIANCKLNSDVEMQGFPSKLILLLFFFFVSLASPLPTRGQDSSSIPSESLKHQDLKSNEVESIEDRTFLSLKERLDRLSRQITKHHRPPSPKIPEYVEKEDLDLAPFPEMAGEGSIEDILLLLRKRLGNLHHVLHEAS